MSPHELRLGNLVWYRDKKIVEISNLGNLFETISLHNGLPYGSDDINEYNGIELTEEWLLKFGFTYKKCGICGQDQWAGLGFYMKDELTLRGDLKRSNLLILSCYFNCQIEYVHQLQNLYFALTGEELKQIEL